MLRSNYLAIQDTTSNQDLNCFVQDYYFIKYLNYYILYFDCCFKKKFKVHLL